MKKYTVALNPVIARESYPIGVIPGEWADPYYLSHYINFASGIGYYWAVSKTDFFETTIATSQ